MIRLVRTAAVTGDLKKLNDADDALEKLYRDKFPQVKSVEYWHAITGPIASYEAELTFESLAKEEEWAKAVIKDDTYRKNLTIQIENLGEIRDDLYRKLEG
jgi:hypothetical protein